MDSKPWYQSKTIWGTLIAGVCLVLNLTGVGEVSPDDQSTLTNNITDIAILGGQIVGIVLAFIGRMKASTVIGEPS